MRKNWPKNRRWPSARNGEKMAQKWRKMGFGVISIFPPFLGHFFFPHFGPRAIFYFLANFFSHFRISARFPLYTRRRDSQVQWTTSKPQSTHQITPSQKFRDTCNRTTYVRRLFVTCCVFTRYFFVAFSWFFRGFFVALFCLEKQCSGLFRYFFVVFSWPLFLEQSSLTLVWSVSTWHFNHEERSSSISKGVVGRCFAPPSCLYEICAFLPCTMRPEMITQIIRKQFFCPQGPCHIKNTTVILIHYGGGKKIRQ